MAWGARKRRRKQVTKKQAWEERGDRHTQQEGGDDDDDGDDRRIEEEEGVNCERRRRRTGGLKAQVENAEEKRELGRRSSKLSFSCFFSPLLPFWRRPHGKVPGASLAGREGKAPLAPEEAPLKFLIFECMVQQVLFFKQGI